MPDFSEHNVAITKLSEAQDADKDMRKRAREAHSFLNDRNGQWEQDVFDANINQPRYTFDMSSPIRNQIAGEMQQADFAIKVKPAGGEASKEDALIYDGLIRNIQTISNAPQTYNDAGRNMVTAGIAGWRIVQKYVSDDSFDQDLAIEPINNFVDRVWFDPSAEMQDKSDADYCYVLQSMSKDKYDEKFPEGSGMSVSDDRDARDSDHRNNDDIVVGQIYFKTEVMREILEMSNGATYENNEATKKVLDEFKDAGITVTRTRKRNKTVVVSRLFDASDWLNAEQEQVFSWLPVIPTYGNFNIVQNTTLYYGVVEKLLDPQRIMNYTTSREIGEGALAPRAKWWMTLAQMLGHEKSIKTLNTNNEPVQTYNHVPGVPPPVQTGGAQINPGLRVISDNMINMMNQTSGMHASNMGENPGLQSGVAIKRLQDRGDIGSIQYFSSQEIAICHTAKILIHAIPKVYDTKRQVRILSEDGSFDMKTLNDEVGDNQTGEMVSVNDLSKGVYDVTCTSGPSFQSRQEEATAGLVELGQILPDAMLMGADIMTKNMSFPDSDKLSERMRKKLFNAGAIPISQMNEEELELTTKAMAKAEENAGQPSADVMIGQAMIKEADVKEREAEISIQEKGIKLNLDGRRLELDEAKAQNQAANDQTKLAQSSNNNQFDQFMAAQKLQMEQTKVMLAAMNDATDRLNTEADTMKKIREASGVEAIVGPGVIENFKEQSDRVSEAQEGVEG